MAEGCRRSLFSLLKLPKISRLAFTFAAGIDETDSDNLLSDQGKMTIKAIEKVSVGQNGLGAFILQCKRLDIHYCDHSGSSRGMNAFIKHQLPQFAKTHPQIEFAVSPRPRKHPVMIGHYINGKIKSVCVKNMEAASILKKAELLRDASGDKVKKVNKPVTSISESVRGVWSPYHGNGMQV
ncbi:mitochondrial ribosomal protein [Seiridium cupressi]